MEEEPNAAVELPDFDQDGPALFDAAPTSSGRGATIPTGRSAGAPADDGDAPGVAQVEPIRLASADLNDADDAPLALYRRYRPEVFAEVIGQDHVTEPLQRALTNNRVNHAYLFSGPRGCGKTSSARILARSLNCEQGPTATPCGQCQSCRELGRGGGGSLDVIEIDAASHGGVDDARDLRERAFFAPVAARYKIYIVDEAHMVSQQGFNALLKLVEEPPPHVKFIFATTEPDKVIGTIRSRTHHYPFRLIPPKTMATYLGQICQQERVEVDPAAIQLVVRAGAGSVRDSLSVLDQLLGGAGRDGVKYAQAAALLGYTPDSLLDEIIDAFAAGSAQGVFAGVDRVIESGQDPRRFSEDLLQRFRDLMIVAAVPDALTSGLLDVAEDQADRFRRQAEQLQVSGLTRAAEILAAGLVAMRGTTAPRLNLELVCSRILLPGSQAGERGLAARLERLEKQVADQAVVRPAVVVPAVATAGPAPAAGRAPGELPVDGSLPTQLGGPVGLVESPKPSGSAESAGGLPAEDTAGSTADTAVRAGRPADDTAVPAGASSVGDTVVPVARTASPQVSETTDRVVPSRPSQAHAGQRPERTAEAPLAPERATEAGQAPEPTTEAIQAIWQRVLQRVSRQTRYIWMILNQYASVTELVGPILWLTFSDPAARDNFAHRDGEAAVAAALKTEMGVDLVVRARLESEPIPSGGRTAILSLARPVEPTPPARRPPAPAGSPNPPGGSAEPARSDQPVVANAAVGPSQSAPATRPDDPDQPVGWVQANELGQPVVPAESVSPAAPAKPIAPVVPPDPADPAALPDPTPRPGAHSSDTRADGTALPAEESAVEDQPEPVAPDPDEPPPARSKRPTARTKAAAEASPTPADPAAKGNAPVHRLGPTNRKAAPDEDDEPDIESDAIIDSDQSEAETIIDDVLGATFVKEEATRTARRPRQSRT